LEPSLCFLLWLKPTVWRLPQPPNIITSIQRDYPQERDAKRGLRFEARLDKK
jgi:hypothetical protein